VRNDELPGVGNAAVILRHSLHAVVDSQIDCFSGTLCESHTVQGQTASSRAVAVRPSPNAENDGHLGPDAALRAWLRQSPRITRAADSDRHP
jgi:hypothetical protein